MKKGCLSLSLELLFNIMFLRHVEAILSDFTKPVIMITISKYPPLHHKVMY